MTRNEKTKKITLTAIFSAMIIILSFLPLKIGAIEMTLAIIPIAVGAILGGRFTGLVLGLVFGLVSFIQCFGFSAFGVQLLAINWFYTLLVCIPTRILAGYITGLLFEIISKHNKLVGIITASVIMPLLNTLLFTGMFIILFNNSAFFHQLEITLNSTNIFSFVVGFVGINGLVEALCGILITIPIAKALQVYTNRYDV